MIKLTEMKDFERVFEISVLVDVPNNPRIDRVTVIAWDVEIEDVTKAIVDWIDSENSKRIDAGGEEYYSFVRSVIEIPYVIVSVANME